jgi:hypothetical protein
LDKREQGKGLGTKPAVASLAIVAALAMGLTAGLLLDRQEPRHDVDPALAQILARLDALEARSIRTSVRTGGIPGAANSDSLRQSGLAAGMPLPGTRKQAEAALQERARTFESRFSQDAEDSAAAQVEIDMLKAMARQELATTGLVPKNADVQCRRHSSRITADFLGTDDALEWALHYVTLLGQGMITTAQPIVATNPDGSVGLLLYASRASGT